MEKKTKQVVISQEYLDKVRRFIAIRPDEEFVYIPVAFRELPAEAQPKFTLRPISGEDALRFSDSMRGNVSVEQGKAQVSVKRGEYTVNVVKAGLISWENFYDAKGNVVEFSPSAFENLSIGLLEELCDIIVSKTSLTDEEVLGLK